MVLPRSRPLRIAVTLLVLAILIAVGLSLSMGAEADTANIPVTATAAPTTNLVSGSVIDINVDAQSPPNASPSLIYSVEARLCRPGVNINSASAFNPVQSGNCISAPLDGSDVLQIDSPPPPQNTAHTTFKVGVGSQDLAYVGGTNHIQCGPDHSCQLVLKLSVPGGLAFKHFDLLYAGSSTTTSSSTTSSSTTSSTSTSSTSTTSTTTPVAGGTYFHPVTPVRILDSRIGPGFIGKVASGTPKSLQVTGSNGVPAGANAAVINVTVTGGSNNSFLTAFPTGGSVPTASNLNFAAGQTIPNLVTVKIGSGGQVAFANAVGSVDVIADLVGFYSSGVADRYTSVPPTRILDSRGGPGFTGKVAAGTPKSLQVTGTASVPASADAVVMNVTVTGGSLNSFLTAYPAGTPAAVSNLNFAAGETIPNLVTVKLGSGGANAGKVTFANNQGSVDVIADVVGYFDASTGDLFHSMAPNRILDSRVGPGFLGKVNAGAPKTLAIHGAAGIPATATGVIGNTTATGGTNNSFLTVYPAGVAVVPTASNLNFAVGQTIPNLVAVKIGTGGQISFANNTGGVDVIFDAVGYYAAT